MLDLDCVLVKNNNLSVSNLVKCAVEKEGGKLSSSGALVINTGSSRTGRSPNDKFIVKDEQTKNAVNWGKINKPFSKDDFNNIWCKVQGYLENNSYDFDKFNNINQSITELSKYFLEHFNLHHNNFELSIKDKIAIKNTLTDRNIFKGKKFSINDEELKDFMINRFEGSNNVVENFFDISINKFLL